MIDTGKKVIEPISKIIFQNANFALRYTGGDPRRAERVVVSFPDLIHHTGFEAPGWGESFFQRRGQPVICVLFKKANWYQSQGFFDAMKAVRRFLGTKVKITSYGASMGGYGAILAGKTLKADHVLALCPQYSIQQDVTPFERRYRDQAREIGTFIYDIDAEIDDKINYVVIYDPTHNIDRRHEAMFRRPREWARVPIPGSAHGVLPNILEMGSKDDLLNLILNQISPVAFRQVMRAGRISSPRYIRRMGNLTVAKHRSFTPLFIDLARERSYFRLVEKWQEALREGQALRPEIILHPGLPKTGSSAIQLYFKTAAKKYRKRGVSYPLEGADARVFSHSWMSKALRERNLAPFSEHLRRVPLAVKKLVLSDESLYLEAPLIDLETYEKLNRVFAPYSVRIVFCQRPLAKWKKSFYLQALKNKRSTAKQSASRLWGTNLSYRKFYEDDFVRELMDFNTRMKELAEIIGADHLEVVKMKPGKNIVPDFCKAAGLRYFQEAPVSFENPSLSDVDGEIQRQANGFITGQAGFVKRLLGLNAEFDACQLRANRLRKFASMGAGLPWQDFSFRTNAPLKYTKGAFVARIKEIENYAKKIAQAEAKL